jgi:hypothetical protein
MKPCTKEYTICQGFQVDVARAGQKEVSAAGCVLWRFGCIPPNLRHNVLSKVLEKI